jgi:hypothetical protein
VTNSQKRLLDRLRSIPASEVTDDDREDLEELQQLEREEEEAQKKTGSQDDPLKEINERLGEIVSWMKPKTEEQKTEVEIPTPPPAIQNDQLDQETDQPIQESKIKKILKSLW